MTPDDTTAIDVLARTLFGEARGESILGKKAVAAVVMNRVRHPTWWGSDVVSVCKARAQFSCWNADDPNCAIIQRVNGGNNPIFTTCLVVAEQAVRGTLADPTNGADSYFATWMSPPPSWAARAQYRITIGRHAFYTVLAAAPSGEPEAETISADKLTLTT